MSLRTLWLAIQFLTRLPVPRIREFSSDDLSRAAAWFPFVGMVLGACVAAVTASALHRSSLLAAALGVLSWTWLSGALHLDGLADLTDALAARHRDPARFLAVLADPHVGAFGTTAIVLTLILKFAALAQLSVASLAALTLVLAWARLGPLVWSRWLKPLQAGSGERFAWHISVLTIALWSVALLIASVFVAPTLCAAPLAIAAWGGWLHWRLGGMTGDCLGAGVEVVEIVLLLALVLTGNAGVPISRWF